MGRQPAIPENVEPLWPTGRSLSTMCTVLSGNTLPDRLDIIDAIVEGCGGTEEDRRRFATAWRELTMARSQPRVVRPFRQAYTSATG